jgi:hypothetical protein
MRTEEYVDTQNGKICRQWEKENVRKIRKWIYVETGNGRICGKCTVLYTIHKRVREYGENKNGIMEANTIRGYVENVL